MPLHALDLLPFGAQYYRAPTPLPDAWESDLRHMAEQGLNTVKIWACWRSNNPREGVYDWSDIDALMEYARQYGLKVILNLIFDAAPAWFFKKYPESVMITNGDGPLHPAATACRQMGGCPGPCLHHRPGIEARRDFIERVVERYQDHPALLCWDLWNEPEHTVCIKRELKIENLTCYCAQSEADFKEWLRAKYGGVDQLNRVWGRNYADFDEVELPRLAQTYKDMIDWRLFMTDTITNEVKMRIAAAKRHDTEHPMMVHTVTIPFFPQATCGSDDYAIAAQCDMFGNSVGSEPLSAAITLSAAPGKMVINSEIHAVGGNTYGRPKLNTLKDMKRHIYLPLSLGIQGFVFWQYRPERLGNESPAWGLTDLSGGRTPWLDAACRINDALQQNKEVLLAARPSETRVAVLNSQRAQLFDFCAGMQATWYIKSVKGAHAMLRAAGYNVDVAGDLQITDAFLSRYRVLYDPFPYYKDEKACAVLRRWVENGGVLIAEATFGGYSDDDGLHTMAQPGFGFDEVFGCREDRVTTASSFHNAYDADWSTENEDENIVAMDGTYGPCRGYYFYQTFAPTTGRALARFADGSCAAVSNTFGKGRAILLGSLPAYAFEACGAAENADFLGALVRGEAGLVPLFNCPKGARADALTAECGQLLVVDNQTDADDVPVTAVGQRLHGGVVRNILTGQTADIAEQDGAQRVCVPVERGGIEVFRVE